jgi:hypothetical protein
VAAVRLVLAKDLRNPSRRLSDAAWWEGAKTLTADEDEDEDDDEEEEVSISVERFASNDSSWIPPPVVSVSTWCLTLLLLLLPMLLLLPDSRFSPSFILIFACAASSPRLGLFFSPTASSSAGSLLWAETLRGLFRCVDRVTMPLGVRRNR